MVRHALYGQVGFFVAWQLHAGAAVYNQSAPFAIRGPLDVDALRRAEREILCRHEALRTVFRFDAEDVVREVREPQPCPLEILDGSTWSDEEAMAALDARTRMPIDLENGPVYQPVLVHRPGRESYLAHVSHHATLDGVATQTLNAELFTLYAGGSLPPAVNCFDDFVAWERALVDGPVGKKQLEHWQQALARVRPLALPSERPRPPARRGAGAAHYFRLGAAIEAGVGRLAQAKRTTTTCVLLAAFQVLLHRYTGAPCFAVAMPASRTPLRFSGLVGNLFNLVLQIATFGPDDTFGDALARTHERMQGAVKNREIPFSVVTAHVKALRGPSGPFQVSFGSLPSPADSTLTEDGMTWDGASPFARTGFCQRVGPLEFEHLLHPMGAYCDLGMQVTADRKDGMVGWLRYDTDVLDAARVALVARDYAAVVEAIVADPSVRLAALPACAAYPARRPGRP